MGNLQVAPYIKDLNCDAETKTMFATLRFKTNSYKKKIAINIPIDKAEEFYKNYKKVNPQITFTLSDNKIILSEIKAKYKVLFYKAKITEKDYKPEIVKIEVKKVNYKLQDTKYGAVILSYFEDDGKGYQDDIPNLIQNIKQKKVNPKNWLVTIGIEDYDNTDKIKYSNRSAKNFKKVAKKIFGVSERNSYTFIDSKATS